MYIADTVPDTVIKNFEDYRSKLVDGGVVLVEGHNGPEAVMLSMEDYEDYKAMKNREYLAKLDEAEAQFERGEYVTLTPEQLAAL